MTASSHSHGNLWLLAFAFGYLAFTAWDVADGEPFRWRVAVDIAMTLVTAAAYVLSRRPRPRHA
ncbi:hypothetical protein [Nocardioides sp. T2.26MG-1]|uniref:hypothetical protein n=1 Tax=Nocardioides sp. T2.26MG-1 TaxID=3041166 RepID=UPI0025426382|nr:hypothetical protein [Nocardioides sp. T2.26MG-1]